MELGLMYAPNKRILEGLFGMPEKRVLVETADAVADHDVEWVWQSLVNLAIKCCPADGQFPYLTVDMLGDFIDSELRTLDDIMADLDDASAMAQPMPELPSPGKTANVQTAFVCSGDTAVVTTSDSPPMDAATDAATDNHADVADPNRDLASKPSGNVGFKSIGSHDIRKGWMKQFLAEDQQNQKAPVTNTMRRLICGIEAESWAKFDAARDYSIRFYWPSGLSKKAAKQLKSFDACYTGKEPLKSTDRFYFAGEAIPEMQIGALAVNCSKPAVNVALVRSWKFYCPTWNIPAGEEPTLKLETELVDIKISVGQTETTVQIPVWYLTPLGETGAPYGALIRPFFPSEEKAERASMRKPKDRVTSDESFKLFSWKLANFTPADNDEPAQSGSKLSKRGFKIQEVTIKKADADQFAHMRDCSFY